MEDWNNHPLVKYILEKVVSNPICSQAISELNISEEIEGREVCPDDIYDTSYPFPNEDDIMAEWFEQHPDTDEIPAEVLEELYQQKKRDDIMLNIPARTCQEMALALELTFDIIRLGSLARVKRELGWHYSLRFRYNMLDEA